MKNENENVYKIVNVGWTGYQKYAAIKFTKRTQFHWSLKYSGLCERAKREGWPMEFSSEILS